MPSVRLLIPQGIGRVGPAAALLLISIWEIAVVLRSSAEVPRAQWQAVAAAVREGYRPGDLIVFAPRWIDPLGRWHLGDMMTPQMVGRADAARYGTIWEVSMRGAQASETRRCRTAWEGGFGLLRVRRYACSAAVVETDFVDALARGRIEGTHRAAPIAQVESVDWGPRLCVRVVPTAEGITRVVYPAVALGREIVGYVGLIDDFPRFRAPSEQARLEVLVDQERRAEVTVQGPWTRFTISTRPAAHAEVVFAVEALGPADPERRVCFAAEAHR